MLVTGRRAFMLGVAAMTVAGCDAGRDNRPTATATVTNNDDIQQWLNATVSAVSSLNGAIEEFDSSNWRDVVPEVKTAADNVTYSVSKLKAALGAK